MGRNLAKWWLWHRKQVSQARIRNCIPQDTMGCNKFSLPKILDSSTKMNITRRRVVLAEYTTNSNNDINSWSTAFCCGFPYPEPVYTGWSSVHWNATGMPLVDPVYTGISLEKLSWNSPKLECHWRNSVESAPHWDATGETLTFAAYTGTPLEGLWQPTHAPTHIVKHAE